MRYLRRFLESLAECEEVQEKMEQIQCCLHYPGRGFQKDAIRIVSIDMPDWKALREQVAGIPQAQSLAGALSQDLPIVISRDELNVLKHECDLLAHQMGVDFYLHSGLLTFSLFVGQSLEQREAGARLEHWPGEYFENRHGSETSRVSLTLVFWQFSIFRDKRWIWRKNWPQRASRTSQWPFWSSWTRQNLTRQIRNVKLT